MALTSAVACLDGWYDEERDDQGAFRWMGRAARCRVAGGPGASAPYLKVTVGHGRRSVAPMLSLSINGGPATERRVRAGMSSVLLAIDASGDVEIDLTVDHTFRSPGDTRRLGLMVRAIEVVDVNRLVEPVQVEGWYEWERDRRGPFRWIAPEARVIIPGGMREAGSSMALAACTLPESRGQVLTVSAGDRVVAAVTLDGEWRGHEVPLPAAPATGGIARPPLDLALRIAPPVSQALHLADDRWLGARLAGLCICPDARSLQAWRVQYESAPA